jgi:hypothetical protein
MKYIMSIIVGVLLLLLSLSAQAINVKYHTSLEKTAQFAKEKGDSVSVPELMHHFKQQYQLVEQDNLIVVPTSPAGPVADATCGSCVFFTTQLRNLGTLVKSSVFAWFIHDTCEFLGDTHGHDLFTESFCDLAGAASFITTAKFLQSTFDPCGFCVNFQIGPFSLNIPGPCSQWTNTSLFPVQCGFFDLICCPHPAGICEDGKPTCAPAATTICLSDPSVPVIYQDAQPPAPDPFGITGGWYFKNTGSPNKINWYFYEILATPEAEQITLGDLDGTWYLLHIYNADDSFIIGVYTVPLGDNTTDANWYRQRLNYVADLQAYEGQTVVLYFGTEPTLPALDGYPKIQATQSANTCGGLDGDGANCDNTGGGGSKWLVDPTTEPNNKIMKISLGTNSGAAAGAYEFTVLQTGILEATLPQEATPGYDLQGAC